jgi:phospholipase C
MPGTHYSAALQYQAQDLSKYSISSGGKTPYTTLPTPQVGGPKANSNTAAPFNTIAQAMAAENGLPNDYYVNLTIGATGLPSGPIMTGSR